MDDLILKVYGDSLSLPRPKDGIGFGKEYSYLLKKRVEKELNKEVFCWNRSMGGARVDELFNHYERDKYYIGKEGILIIQSGVVDCAPRPLPIFLREIVSLTPEFLKWRIVKFLHNNRAKILKAGLGTKPTSPKKYRLTMEKWIKSAIEIEKIIFVINIAPNTDEIEKHSPGFRKSIKLYNQILESVITEINSQKVILIDAYSAIKEKDKEVKFLINQKDGHHITKDGHLLYSELLFDKISTALKCD